MVRLYTTCPKTHMAFIWIQWTEIMISVHEKILATEAFLHLYIVELNLKTPFSLCNTYPWDHLFQNLVLHFSLIYKKKKRKITYGLVFPLCFLFFNHILEHLPAWTDSLQWQFLEAGSISEYEHSLSHLLCPGKTIRIAKYLVSIYPMTRREKIHVNTNIQITSRRPIPFLLSKCQNFTTPKMLCKQYSQYLSWRCVNATIFGTKMN